MDSTLKKMLQRRNKMRFYKNFTLIELLVVMAIIVLLASMLTGALGQVRKSAYQTKCLSQLRELQKMAQIYADDYDEKFYPSWISNLYNEYHKSAKLYKCPSDKTDPDNLSGLEQRSQNRFAGADDYDKVSTTFDSPVTLTVPGYSTPTADVPEVSYIYEFCGGMWPNGWGNEKNDNDEEVTPKNPSWQAMKLAVLRSSQSLYTKMPLIRCFWHTTRPGTLEPVLNIAPGGNTYLSKSRWQDGM